MPCTVNSPFLYNFINQHAPLQGPILHAREFMYICYVLKYIHNIGCLLEYTVSRVNLLFLLYICMYEQCICAYSCKLQCIEI